MVRGMDGVDDMDGMDRRKDLDSCLPTPTANKLSVGGPGRRNDGGLL